MKRIFYVILMVAIVLSLSSCALHYGLTANLNNSTTNVVLQTNNYKIIKKVEGSATGTRILCLFGGFQRPLVEKARNEMLKSANLIGKSRAVINETIEENNKFFLLVGFKTVTVSAYVIEFIGDGTVRETGTVSETNTVKEDEEVIENNTDIVRELGTVREEEKVIENIDGKWENSDFEITINGNVGVLSKIYSGVWLTFLKKNKVHIGGQIFKDIRYNGKSTWKCKEMIPDDSGLVLSTPWTTSNLTLDEGNILTVKNGYRIYTLTKVKEEK